MCERVGFDFIPDENNQAYAKQCIEALFVSKTALAELFG